jgi:hypothetical protein
MFIKRFNLNDMFALELVEESIWVILITKHNIKDLMLRVTHSAYFYAFLSTKPDAEMLALQLLLASQVALPVAYFIAFQLTSRVLTEVLALISASHTHLATQLRTLSVAALQRARSFADAAVI